MLYDLFKLFMVSFTELSSTQTFLVMGIMSMPCKENIFTMSNSLSRWVFILIFRTLHLQLADKTKMKFSFQALEAMKMYTLSLLNTSLRSSCLNLNNQIRKLTFLVLLSISNLLLIQIENCQCCWLYIYLYSLITVINLKPFIRIQIKFQKLEISF